MGGEDRQGSSRRRLLLLTLLLAVTLVWSIQAIDEALGVEGDAVTVLEGDVVYLNGEATLSDAVLLANALRESRFHGSPPLTMELHVPSQADSPHLVRLWMDEAWIRTARYRLKPQDAERISRRLFDGAAVQVVVPGEDGMPRMGCSTPSVILMPAVRRLLERYGGAGTRKQLRRRSVVQKVMPWRWDPTTGRLTYGDGSSWDAVLLGFTRSEGTARLWRWVLQGPSGARLRQKLDGGVGADWESVWGVGDLPIRSNLTVKAMGVVVAGMFDVDDAITLRDDFGTNIFVIDDDDWPAPASLTPQMLAMVFDNLVSRWPVSHRPATMAALKGLGCDVVAAGGASVGSVRFQCSGLPLVDMHYDDQGRFLWLRGVTN